MRFCLGWGVVPMFWPFSPETRLDRVAMVLELSSRQATRRGASAQWTSFPAAEINMTRRWLRF